MDVTLMKQAADHLAQRLEPLLDDISVRTIEIGRDDALLLLGIVNGVRETLAKETQL